MAYNLIFNAAATDPKSALCKSVTNLTPINPPAWVVGESRVVNLYVADGLGNFDALSGDGTAEVTLGLGRIGAVPTGGTFTITSGANTTTALAYNASAATISTALNLLASITAEGGVTVSGTFPVLAVDWVTVGAKALMAGTGTLLTPDSAASVSRVRTGDGSTKERQLLQLSQQPAALQTSFSTITDGWSASFNLNTRGIVDLVGTSASISDAYLELRVVDAIGNVRIYGQVGNIIRNRVIDPLALVPPPLPDYLTATASRAQFVQNRSTLTGLTGGSAADLDGIATANDAAQVGWLAAVTIDDVTDLYQLQTGGDATSEPEVIRPADFDAASNLRVWRLTLAGSASGGGGELQFWTESTELVSSTQASVWKPNATGMASVAPNVTPVIDAETVSSFGTFPAGTYRVNYVGGAMRYGPGLTQFKLNAAAGYGFRVEHDGGATTIEGPYTSYTGYATVAAVEAANAGAYVEFVHTGGTIGVRLEDSPINDNSPGTPNPTFQLVGANADLHAVIQPIGTGSVILADDLSAAPVPTATSQLTARFAGGYKFDGGAATFESTAAGDDPAAAQDFVTRAYFEANSAGTRPPYAMPANEADFDEADIFTKTLAADVTLTFANVPDGGTFQIVITQPTPAWAITWPTVAWVGGGSAPLAPAGKTTIFTFERIGAVYHGVAALAGADVAWGSISGTLADQLDLQAALDAKGGNGQITAEAGVAIAARDVVWQDTEDRLSGGALKWYPEDLSTSPPNVGVVRGMAIAADDGGTTADLSGAVAAYHFDNSPADATGNGNTLTAPASPYVTPGKLGTHSARVRFSSGRFSRAATGTDLQAAAAFSVAFWLKFTAASTGGEAIVSHAVIPSPGATWDYAITLSTTGDSSLGAVKAIVRQNSVGVGGGANVSGTVTYNAWHLVTMTFDGTDLNLSLDGAAFITAAVPTPPTIASGTFSVGSGGTGYSYVDEVVKWNRALTLAQIVDLYNAGAGRTYPYPAAGYNPGNFTCLIEPGDVAGFSGLTPGAKQFSDQTVAGTLTETTPTSGQLRRFNGWAKSATVLRFDPRGQEPQQNDTPDAARWLNEFGQFSTPFLTATAALDFPNILAAASADLTITVTGAAVGDAVILGPPAAPDASLTFLAFVSAADTVTVRAFNIGAIPVDQASMTFRATVIH